MRRSRGRVVRAVDRTLLGAAMSLLAIALDRRVRRSLRGRQPR